MSSPLPKIRLGISACLLGEKVRYDGGHKLDSFLRDTLGRFVEWVPVCPEKEAGFPTPREAFHLEGDPESPTFITVRTRIDYTERMRSYSLRRARELEKENLCGFVFMQRSPSSGMERVKVYNEKGMAEKKGVGVFARAFKERFPLLPVEEAGRLNDPVLRDNFIERIFTLARWRELVEAKKTRGGLVKFHTRHKLLIRSHDERRHNELGRLAARAKELHPKELFDTYQARLLEALKLKATVKKHYNVLQHVLGYFKKVLSPDEKRELLEIFSDYRKGLVPLLVPVTLVNHYVRKYDEPYLKEQYYLNPHPRELQLRNHV